MTKFFLWIFGEDPEQHLDLAAKVVFNSMMLTVCWLVLINVIGMFLAIEALVRLY